MARKKNKKVRVIKEDFIFSSILVSKFINYLMKNGKKKIAERIMYSALYIIYNRLKDVNKDVNVLEILKLAIKNVSPIVDIRSRRVGGASYQIPVNISMARSLSFGIRWIIEAARKRFGYSMDVKLADELMDASNSNINTGKSVGTGEAIKKKENICRMAEANKTFIHYNW